MYWRDFQIGFLFFKMPNHGTNAWSRNKAARASQPDLNGGIALMVNVIVPFAKRSKRSGMTTVRTRIYLTGI